MITIQSTLLKNEKTGELYVRYHPTLKPRCIASGQLSFASFDVAVGAPPVQHEAACAWCRHNVIATLETILHDLSPSQS